MKIIYEIATKKVIEKNVVVFSNWYEGKEFVEYLKKKHRFNLMRLNVIEF